MIDVQVWVHTCLVLEKVILNVPETVLVIESMGVVRVRKDGRVLIVLSLYAQERPRVLVEVSAVHW